MKRFLEADFRGWRIMLIFAVCAGQGIYTLSTRNQGCAAGSFINQGSELNLVIAALAWVGAALALSGLGADALRHALSGPARWGARVGLVAIALASAAIGLRYNRINERLCVSDQGILYGNGAHTAWRRGWGDVRRLVFYCQQGADGRSTGGVRVMGDDGVIFTLAAGDYLLYRSRIFADLRGNKVQFDVGGIAPDCDAALGGELTRKID